MKRYLISLLILTLLLAVAGLVFAPIEPFDFRMTFLALAGYFAVITAIQHLLITRSTRKDPRTFVRNFFGIIMGVLAIHFVVLIIYMFGHIHQMEANKVFTIGFMVGFFSHLVFETTAQVLYLRRSQKESEKQI